MPRKNVPHRVDEIADSILAGMKSRKTKMPKEKQYDIAYGTAWKQYYKENPKAKFKSKQKKAQDILENLKLAQNLDECGFFQVADKVDQVIISL